MMAEPNVGQKIRLNDHGLWVIFNNTRGLKFMKTRVYTITNVKGKVPVEDRDIWYIEIDDEDLNRFLFDSGCFDEI